MSLSKCFITVSSINSALSIDPDNNFFDKFFRLSFLDIQFQCLDLINNYKFFELILILAVEVLNFFGPFSIIDTTAFAASKPLLIFFDLIIPHLS